MNTQSDKITITERAILELVRYKTRNNYIFFGGNDYIASAIDITKNSAKTLINALIRKGYLNKAYDKHKRRVLSLSGKPYLRLFDDYTGLDKKIISLERDDALRDSLYYQGQLEASEATVERLQTENLALQERVGNLEAFFYKNGISKEQLEVMINNK